jgi:hypothetical protein
MVKLLGLLPKMSTWGVNVTVAPGGNPLAERVTGTAKAAPIGSRLNPYVTAPPGYRRPLHHRYSQLPG